MRPWIYTDSKRWEQEQLLAKKLLTETSVEVGPDGCCSIYGVMRVRRAILGDLGPFFLKILYPPDFPAHDPNVYLLNQEGWRDPSNHIEGDGRFCWVEVKDSPIDFSRENSLKLLMENISFRLMQVEMKLRKKLPSLPGPERSHADAGEREAKRDRKRRGIGPNTRPCICGKNVKYKYCHGRKEIFRRNHGTDSSRSI